MDQSSRILSNIIVYTKYAKFREDLGRRETWSEVVERNRAMHLKKFKKAGIDDLINEAFEYVENYQVLPSMRSAQFAGKPMEISPVRGYNCFSVDTPFVTKEGVKSFAECSHNEQITVLTHTGEWKSAAARSYGKQQLFEITLVRGRSTFKVKATKNHRWLLKDGTETTSLKVGDQLLPAPNLFDQFSYEDSPVDERLYWAYGFVFGDGTTLKNKDGEYTRSLVRLCGNDTKYLPRFEELGFKSSTPLSLNGDVFVYTGSYLKTVPDATTDDPRLIRAFVRGYLDADGAKVNDSTMKSTYRSIVAKGADHQYVIEKLFPVAGVYLFLEKDLSGQETNFGTRRNTKFYSLSTCVSEPRQPSFVVKEIKPLDVQEVWCLEVEDTESFVLPFGVSTGNCSYLPIDAPDAFSEVMFLLLSGCGVGYSVQKHHVENLPEITKTRRTKRFLIGDSIEGWADSIKVLISHFFLGKSKPVFDFSDIRPKGALLKTSGGRAPGPEPLRDCLHNIETLLERKSAGDKLSTVEAHDILCHIADAVLAGGIRRAAMIALFSFDDQDMIECKFGKWYELNPQRARANNSAVVLRHKISQEDFFEFWDKMRYSTSGDPGFMMSNDQNWGINPCAEVSLRPFQFCVSGDTRLITRTGITSIAESVGQEIDVWNGNKWSSVVPFQTGEADTLYRITFSDGSVLDATENHRFLVKTPHQKDFKEKTTLEIIRHLQTKKSKLYVPRSNILYKDGEPCSFAYELGFFLGDGNLTSTTKKPVANLYGKDKQLPLVGRLLDKVYYNQNGTEYRTIEFTEIDVPLAIRLKTELGLPQEVFSWDRDSIIKFVSGWLDADGSVGGLGLRLYGQHNKLADAQLLLTKCGINCSLNLMAKKGTRTNLGVRKNDVWYLQITKTTDLVCHRLPCTNDKDAKHKGKYQIIRTVTKLEGTHKTFCVSEDELHQCVFNNVLTKQCNLASINVSDVSSQEELEARARAAAIIATLQASYTDFHYLREEWKETTEKEALIGVSMTGIASGNVMSLDLKKAADVVKKANAEIARKIGIKSAARCTVIKPEGTSSLVLGTSSGIHAWHSKYYIRRMRVLKNEPIYQYLSKVLPELVEDDYFKPRDQAVIAVPIKAPKDCVTREEPALELLSRVETVYNDWIIGGHRKGHNKNNVSCTVTVKPEEWDSVRDWMWENRAKYTALSIFPYVEYDQPQLPFEEITKSEYDRLSKLAHDIDLTEVLEFEDNTNLKGELACAGGACEIT